MRIDKYLTDTGLAVSRAKAQEMLRGGAVSVDGVTVIKPSFDVSDTMKVVLIENPLQKYVGRGGLKLEAALSGFGLSPEGRVAVDIGASSGGFTDCLLQHGASYVYAVDSGHGQLHPDLLADKRVCSMEGVNARYLEKSDFPLVPSFAVMDVSFISQTLILPSLVAIMADESTLVSLVKPQFELGKAALGKGGIVKSEKLCKEALAQVCAFAESIGLRCMSTMPSPIRGGDGNLEFLAAFSFKRRHD